MPQLHPLQLQYRVKGCAVEWRRHYDIWRSFKSLSTHSSSLLLYSRYVVCMYVCVYVCIYVCICMYIFIYVCIYVCMQVCVCIWCICHLCMYVCMYVCIMCVCVCMYACMCVCMHACVYVYVSVYVCVCNHISRYTNKSVLYVCMYVCMYICMYICMYVQGRKAWQDIHRDSPPIPDPDGFFFYPFVYISVGVLLMFLCCMLATMCIEDVCAYVCMYVYVIYRWKKAKLAILD